MEAVAAVKAFGLDDGQCLGHEYYPGDLLRPDGPSAHSVHERDDLAKESTVAATKPKSWLDRLLRR